MATAKQFRAKMIAIAADALRDEPKDIGARARQFVARLSAAMATCGEPQVEQRLDELLSMWPGNRCDGA